MKIWVFFAVSVGRRVSFLGPSLLSYNKRRHLSTSRVIPLIDCLQSLYHQHRILSTFLPDLCFIWQSHRCQFFGCALPIGFWQLLMNLQHVLLGGYHGNFFFCEKSVHCVYKRYFPKVSVVPAFTKANKIDAPRKKERKEKKRKKERKKEKD